MNCDYECVCCGSVFTYGETVKRYDGDYGELYLICGCCGGECLPIVAGEEKDEDCEDEW